MPRKPDVRLGVDFRHVGKKLSGCAVISMLLVKRLLDASIVARVCTRGAVAYLVPSPLALLGAATAEE